MTGDVFAFSLLSMPLATAVVIVLAGRRPSWKSVLRAAAFTLPAAFLISLTAFTHSCDKGGTRAPEIFAVVCATALVVSVSRKTVLIPAVVSLLLGGFALRAESDGLVHEHDYIGYTDPPYIGFEDWRPRFHVVPSYEKVREAGDFLEREFKGDRDDLKGEGWIEDVFPALREAEPPPEFIDLGGSRVGRFWHSFFTGIYRWHDVSYGIWCGGGKFEECLGSLAIRPRRPAEATPEDLKQLALDADPCETFLVPLDAEGALGKPLRFRVEIRARAGETVFGLPGRERFLVRDFSGIAAPYIREDPPACRRLELERAPKGAFILLEDFDLLEAYMLPKPGRYTVQFTGRGLVRNAKPSKVVEIDVADGEKPLAYRVAEKLLPLKPENWRMSFDLSRSKLGTRDGGYVKGAEVDLRCTTPKTFALFEIYALERKAALRSHWSESPEYLGMKEGLHWYLVAVGGSEEHWPGGATLLREALKR